MFSVEVNLTLDTGLVLIRLYRYRSDFVHILRSRGSNMNKSGFLRLFLLAFTMLLAILPVQAYVVYYDMILSLPWHPYSWSRIHGPQWHTILKIAAYGHVFFDRWTPIASGFMIFIFFGFGRDAFRMYRTLFWSLGLGYCFPGVARPLDSHATGTAAPTNASNSTTLVGSVTSRAKLLFKHKGSSTRYVTLHSLGGSMTDIFNSSTGTSTFTGSYNDNEKGRSASSRPSGNVNTRRAPWFHRLFKRRQTSRRHNQDTLLDDLSVPSQTVHTNAWAGDSRSRPSNEFASGPSSPKTKDFIHVKQVIRQQSEVQV